MVTQSNHRSQDVEQMQQVEQSLKQKNRPKLKRAITMSTTEELPLEISVLDVKNLLDEGEEFFLLDCREPGEHATAKLDSAVLIPMGEITSRVAELEPVRNRRIIVHCHHGGRSMQVTQWLQQQGFPKVQNMAGGIDAWSVEIDSNVARY
jgi:rhodanese-related sulfurtransferase